MTTFAIITEFYGENAKESGRIKLFLPFHH